MPSLSWYINRLGRMSAAEIGYRAAQAARASVDRVTSSAVPEIVTVPRSVEFMQRGISLDPAPYLSQAQRVMEGRFSIFHLDDCELGHPPEWNRDPSTKRLAPLKPAASLDYRDESLVGNIKYLWEPNRHLHIPGLAQAYALTGERKYADAIKMHLDSWIEQCPFGFGPNWSSALEIGIRLINWSIAWQLIGGYGAPLFSGTEGRAFRDRWLRSVFLHARTIMRKRSRFSSANNHLIGETAGVYVASTTWNCWPQMRTWGVQCKEILVQEAIVQNAQDGGNREQAFSYQQFVLDFLLLAGLAGRAAREDFPPEYWQRIERMIEFLGAMMDVAGHVPMIGDADDGYVVRLAPQDRGRQATVSGLAPASSSQPPVDSSDNYRSLLATGAVLFKRADFARKAGVIDDKTRWLLPPEELGDFARLAGSSGSATARLEFPQSGYYILGSDFDSPDEVRMIVDAGPLGYLSLAAHGHADALSIVLSVAGEEILIDPGTYAYHTEPEWRTYFRSTRAHNTVMVDDCDQSRQSGNFMWSQHAIARCLHFDRNGDVQRFLGEHTGYCVLREPVEHQRGITYDVRKRMFMVTDTLQGRGEHDVCRQWHFSEFLTPTLEGDELLVRTRRHLIRFVPQEPLEHVDIYTGGTPRQGGWVSRSFGRKEPTTTVVWRARARDRATYRTYICVEPLTEC